MNLKQYPTLVGYSALLCWALAAPFTVKISPLPIFQVLTCLFIVSFTVSATKITLCRQWSQLKQPLLFSIIGFVGIYGNDVLYIAAFQRAPASHADLINYLWPVLTILFTGFLPNEKLSPSHLLAAFLGFLGIFILIGHNTTGFKSDYLIGYAFAFADAVVWSVYTVFAQRHGKTPVDMIGIYCGISACFSLMVHLKYEQFVMPDSEQIIVLFCMGLTSQCLAYLFWDFGIKKGDAKLLTVLSYGNPILSIIFLIGFGMAKYSPALMVAAFLVSLGGFIAWLPPISFDKIFNWRNKKVAS